MGRGRKKLSGSRARKVRVEFRRNRARPAREKDWTRIAGESEDQGPDPSSSERVVAKGRLSRKRTIIVDDHAGVDPDDGTRRGTVVTLFGVVAHVEDDERVWPCTIRQVLRTRRIQGRNAVAVGDHVRFTVVADRVGVEAEGVIESVEQRHGELKRVVGRREQIVVANVDQVLIVASAAKPTPKPHLIDRYIVSALHGKMSPVVCLNKIDLMSADQAAALLAPYVELGYQTLATSATEETGIDELRAVLANKKSAIAGQSGVGKSSLLNAVQPGLRLKVGSIVEETAKGRHTTSRATLLKLDLGGYVVDTPGIRSFDLRCVPREQLEQYFVEFVKHVPHCKYPNCAHIHEDACAIRQAVERGEIRNERYDSYVRLFTGIEYRRNATR